MNHKEVNLAMRQMLNIISKWLGREQITEGSIEYWLVQTQRDVNQAPKFFQSWLESKGFAIAQSMTDDSGIHNIELLQFADGANKPFIPLFSELQFLPQKQIPSGAIPYQASGRELLQLARTADCNVVLNPFRKNYKVFAPETVASILDDLRANLESSAISLPPTAQANSTAEPKIFYLHRD